MAKASLDFKRVEKEAIAAFRDAVFLFDRALTQTISTPGAFPSTPEDLVDTGAFRASQKVSAISDTEYRIRWSVDYAIYLYYGWTTRSGRKIPGRPWDQKTLETFDLYKTFEMLMRAGL